jgi:hypothetical protein
MRMSVNRAAPLPVPEKPSIAVLPFQNLSGDPDQEYFADGIVEDILTISSGADAAANIARWLENDAPISRRWSSADLALFHSELE